ncbi:hypothetical protein TNCV_1869201 [Trichonephila clavipes]|nr:hypothetical protein TNCV_1869201 [Trichonephila clavipes]
MKKHQLPLLKTRRDPIYLYSTVAQPNMTSKKGDAIHEELKPCTLEEQRYQANEKLHIYTDGSYLSESNGGDTGRFFRLFECLFIGSGEKRHQLR